MRVKYCLASLMTAKAAMTPKIIIIAKAFYRFMRTHCFRICKAIMPLSKAPDLRPNV